MRPLSGALTALVIGAAPVAILAVPAQAAAGCVAQQDPNQSVQVSVTALEPRNVQPGDTVTVTAVLRNCGTAPLTNVRARVRTANVLATRNDLADADSKPPDTNHAFGDWTNYADGVPPGKAATVVYQTNTVALGLNRIGVYPAELQVQGDNGQGNGVADVGQIRTYLPFFPDGVQQPTEVTYLLPFADRPHRLYDTDTHILYDDDLDTSITGTGRLARMLYVAQQASAAHVPYTLAVDPDLADTLYEMSLGYKVGTDTGTTVDGRGKQDAQAWLAQLAVASAGHDVIALPFADADLVALSGNGLQRLLPDPQDGADLLSSRLANHPVRSDIAWPAGGVLTDDALDQLLSGPVRTVVLDPASLANPRPGQRTDSAASPLPSPGRDAAALVPDQQLDRIVGGQLAVNGGPRLVEQRYLVELAMITAEAPAVQRRVLITPPRNWNIDPKLAVAMLQDTVRVPWLTPGTVAARAATPAERQVDRGALVYPANAPRLSPAQVATLRRCEAILEQLLSSLDNRAATSLLNPYPTALVRSASAAFRGMPTAGRRQMLPVLTRLNTLLDKRVRIVPPDPAKYSLAAQNSNLPLTLVNDLPVAITVRVVITPQGNAGFHAAVRQLTLRGDGRRTQVLIPTTVTQSGRFTVSAALVTLDGKQLGGTPVTLEVQSTAYGVVALGITVGAFGLLLLLLLRRVVQQIRSGPATLVPAGSPAERGR
jgi:Family of unknown function (DUF6049)